MSSSSYGYVPASRVSQLTQHYTVASPPTWTFQRQMSADPADIAFFGGIEVEGSFSQAQKAEITALGGAYFDTSHSFDAWLNQHTA